MWITAALGVMQLLSPDPAATRWIATAPGESVHVTVEGQGPRIVLVPGLVGAGYSFRKVAPALGDGGFQTVVVEPLGIGLASYPPDADYSLTAQAHRVAAALDSLDIRDAILVAHSAGASIALRLAWHRPDLVAGVVSLDGGPQERLASDGFRRAMRFLPWVKLLGGVSRLRKELRKSLIAGSGDTSWVTDAVVAGFTQGAARNLDDVLRVYLRMASTREPEALEPHLAEIRCPVRLLVGTARHDGRIPEAEIALLSDRLPDFVVHRVAGAGLFLQEEAPDRVVAAVEALSLALTPHVSESR